MKSPLLVAIDAKYIHTNNAVRLLKANSKHPVDLLCYTIKDDPLKILQAIRQADPLFVGFSTYIWNVETVRFLTRRLKNQDGPAVVLGGPEVSYEPRPFLESGADLIIRGEGEHVFDAVIEHYRSGQSLADLPNLAYRSDNGEIIERPIKEIDDLSIIESPHRFAFDEHERPHRIHYIESSRGCPHRCTYCLSSLEQSVRFFPVETVLADIDYLLKRGARTFRFLDRSFDVSKHACTIVDYIVAHHTEESVFQFEMTGDNLPLELVEHIHRTAPPGLFRFEVGIQSIHDDVNRKVGRRQDTESLFRTLRKIISANVVDLHLDLIAGLPGESLERFKEGFNATFDLGAKEIQLGFLKLLRGTALRRLAPRMGYLFDQHPPYEVQKSDAMDERDFAELKEVEAALDRFHNRGYFEGTLHGILMETFESPYEGLLSMIRTYREEGLPEKGYQLETLYDFVHRFLAARGVEEDRLDDLKRTYLEQFKTKPKGYFPKIRNKPLRQKLFQRLNQDVGLNVNDAFKHAVCIHYKEGFLVAYYDGEHVAIHELSPVD